MLKPGSPSAAIASCCAHSVSASASSDSEPRVSKSHCVNSRYRSLPGRSARQTGPSAYRLYGLGSWLP